MNHAARIAREQAVTEALRAADLAIGEERPTQQALRIIDALKRLRSESPVVVAELKRVDYLAKVREAAQAAWLSAYNSQIGPEYDAVASVETPIGVLKMIVWRTAWNGGRGQRIAWTGEYYLDDRIITVAEIKAGGLAQRPTVRRRRKKGQPA